MVGWYCPESVITIKIQVDNVFNMDETFILVYPGKDKVLLLKDPWFQLKMTKRESHWQSQLVVFFLYNFSTIHHWYWIIWSRSDDLLEQLHKVNSYFQQITFMTQYAIIIYLEWLLKMFQCQRSLLIGDQSKIHFGTIITDCLETNHSSPIPGSKVFLLFI